jgi:hypothetical protein
VSGTERFKRNRKPLNAALAAVACVVALAACGSSSNPTAISGATHYGQALEFSKCMRAHGVPDFPDPNGSGGINIPAGSGVNPSSPAFEAARSVCAGFLPFRGPRSQHPDAQAMSQARRISQCMRSHGVTGFPDPTLTPPSSPAGYSILEDRGGVIIAVPSTIDPNSPAFAQAAKACQFS